MLEEEVRALRATYEEGSTRLNVTVGQLVDRIESLVTVTDKIAGALDNVALALTSSEVKVEADDEVEAPAPKAPTKKKRSTCPWGKQCN